VEFVCARQRRREKKSYDIFEYAFFSNDEIKTSGSRLHFSSATALISPKQIGNLGMWVHEFTELTLIEILNEWRKPWRNNTTFKNRPEFKLTTIPHFMAPWGLDNDCCLIPQVSRKEPKW